MYLNTNESSNILTSLPSVLQFLSKRIGQKGANEVIMETGWIAVIHYILKHVRYN
jgi:hypothetical protein